MKAPLLFIAALALAACHGGAPAPIKLPLACTFEPDGTLPEGARWVPTGDGWASLEWDAERISLHPLEGAEPIRFAKPSGADTALAATHHVAVLAQANRLRAWHQRGDSAPEPLPFDTLGGLISAQADGGPQARVLVWSSAEPNAIAIGPSDTLHIPLEPALDRRLIPDGSGRWLTLQDPTTLAAFDQSYPVAPGARVVLMSTGVLPQGAFAAWVARRADGEHIGRAAWENQAQSPDEFTLPTAPTRLWFVELEAGPALVMAFAESTLVRSLNDPSIPMTDLPFRTTQVAEKSGQWHIADARGRTGPLRCTAP